MAELKDSAFSRVLARFQSRLSPQSIYEFRLTTYEDLKSFIVELQNEQAQRRGFRNLNKIRPFLNGLEQYAKVIEVFVNAKPDILAFVWRPIKLCLHIASKLTEAFDALLDAYEKIGKSLPIFSMIDGLFPHSYVQQILVDVYEDILDFHKRSVVFFRQGAWKLAFKVAFRTFDDMFGDVIKKLERSKELLLQSANIVHFREAQDARLLFTREFENQEKKRNNDRTLAVIEWLSPVSCNIDHEELQSMRREYPDTTRWILKESSMYGWLRGNGPATFTFWICGIPGAGKTVLFSAIVDEIKETLPDAQVVFFYCKNRDSTKNTFDSVVRSLIAQLLQLNPIIFLDYLYETAITSCQRHPNGFNTYATIFENISKSHNHLFIGIDGLDECEEEERRLILSLIGHISKVSKIQTKTKVFIASQRMKDIEHSLVSATRFDIRHYHVKQDIQNYIFIRSSQLSKKFRFNSEKTKSVIADISSRPKGMFLLARLIMDNLMDQDNIEDLDDELSVNTLPCGINEAYGRIMVHLRKGRSEKSQKRTARILETILTARRPLKLHEIQGALSINVEDSSVDFAKRRSLAPLGDVCGPIVEIHADDTIALVHPTAKQYLIHHDSSFYINALAAEFRMAQSCAEYLMLDCFKHGSDTNNYVVLGAYAFQEYASLNWMYHSIPLLDPRISDRLDKELNERRISLDKDLKSLERSCARLHSCHFNLPQEGVSSHHLQTDANAVYSNIVQLQTFYESITSIPDWDTQSVLQLYLLQHISKVRAVVEGLRYDTECDLSFLEEAYGKFPFKCPILSCPRFRDGFSSKESRDKHQTTHRDRFFCSFEDCDYSELGFTNQYDLSRHLLEHEFPPERAIFPKVKSRSLRKSLEDAIDKNDILSVRTLSMEVLTFPDRYHGYILRAISNGSLEAAKTLLPILGSKEEFEYQDKSRKGVVIAAAENGDEELMQLIIENNAFSTTIVSWDPLLLASSKRGNSQTVGLLLGRLGSNSDMDPNTIRESAQLAIIGGHEDVVQILIDRFWEVCTQHNGFWDMIKAAALVRNKSVVRLLLKKSSKTNDIFRWPSPFQTPDWDRSSKEIDAVVSQLMKNLCKNVPLFDYPTQLMLLELQNKIPLLMVRNETEKKSMLQEGSEVARNTPTFPDNSTGAGLDINEEAK